MKISVKTNSNVIFFETLISLLNPSEKYHPLGEKILRTYEYINELESYKRFKEKYLKKEIPDHIYQYLFLSVHLNANLSPKALAPNDSFGPNRLKGYKEMIYPLVKKVYEESEFLDIYKKEILPEYEKVTEKIQKQFDKERPEKILMDLWGKGYNPRLVFIPDPLRVGGGSGISRNNTLYSITGCVDSDKGIIFKPSYIISNLLHEYSHSFFRYYIHQGENMNNKHIEISESLSRKVENKIDEKVLKNYGSSTTYFEETFIRGVQIYLSMKFFENYVESEELEEKIKKQLEKREKEGFIYIKDFFNSIKKGKEPIQSYVSVLKGLLKGV